MKTIRNAHKPAYYESDARSPPLESPPVSKRREPGEKSDGMDFAASLRMKHLGSDYFFRQII
jgi:hypothetical protein